MSNSENDRLAQQLLDGDWTTEKLGEASRILEELSDHPGAQQILQAYDSIRDRLAPPADIPVPQCQWRVPATGRGRAPLRLGLAAMIVLMIAGWASFMIAIVGDRADSTPAAAAHLVQFAPQDVSRQLALFDSVNEAFDERAGWVATAEGTSELGLLDQTASTAASRVWLLRLGMSHGGRVVASTDLAIVPGQTANVTVPMPGGRSVRYLVDTAPGSPATLSVWAEVIGSHGPGGQMLGALATTIEPRDGQTISAGQLVSADGAYRLEIAFTQASMPAGSHRP